MCVNPSAQHVQFTCKGKIARHYSINKFEFDWFAGLSVSIDQF